MMYKRIQTALVNETYPGDIQDYRNTQYVEALDKYVGEYKKSAPTQAQHSPYTGRWPVDSPANTYTGPEFVAALSDASLEAMMGLAKTSDQVAAVWERIKLQGIDCNEPKALAILDKMENANIIDSTEKTALIG